ncbi:MAG TPA: methyltransferase [Geobacteraceae bacterium]|nr:methyltransferase [Geobacteraceae bacterium]
MPWDPETYQRFKEERAAPFADLCNLIRVRCGLEAIDLGCGTGELTCRLAALLPGSRVTGIDSSAAMLAKADALACPSVRFRQQDIATVDGSWDLIFSNAVFHWIDDHETLIPRLFSLLKPGGQLVAQIPNNNAFPSHTCIIATAGEEPFRSALGGWIRTSPLLSLDAYARLLYESGAGEITVFEKVYLHTVHDADAIADWTTSTTLIPYFERLPLELHAPFMSSYREKLRQIWPAGPVLFTFRRILLAASR